MHRYFLRTSFHHHPGNSIPLLLSLGPLFSRWLCLFVSLFCSLNHLITSRWVNLVAAGSRSTFFENLDRQKCFFLPPRYIAAIYSISCIDYMLFYFKVFGSSLNHHFWNILIMWLGVSLFSFIVLTCTLNLKDYLLLENSGEFSWIMSFFTSLLHCLYLLFLKIKLFICCTSQIVLDFNYSFYFLFSSFLFLLYFFSGVVRFILKLFYSFYFCFHYWNSYKIFYSFIVHVCICVYNKRIKYVHYIYLKNIASLYVSWILYFLLPLCP